MKINAQPAEFNRLLGLIEKLQLLQLRAVQKCPLSSDYPYPVRHQARFTETLVLHMSTIAILKGITTKVSHFQFDA